MEWQPEVKQLYEDMVSRIPEMVRPVIRPVLLEASEKKCAERIGKKVAEVDLVTALFEVTPPAFQPTMIEDLNDFGVDIDIYLAKVKCEFKHDTDLKQMVKDLLKDGEITGVKCNEEAIWKVLNAYKNFYSGSSVSIRTTTRPIEKRDISVRYLEFLIPHDPDPYTTAINEGLIEKNGQGVHEMIKETLDTFEILGYGVDLDVRVGLSKIWTFVVPGPTEPIFSMKLIPKSIKTHMEYFKKHEMTSFSLFGFDFRHNTTNLYFTIKDPSKATPEIYESLLKELDFEIASKEVMERCCDAITIYYTFSWDSNEVERICFGVTCQDVEKVPVHFHPLMKKFLENAPVQAEKRMFIYSITFTRNGLFYKIESDYSGTFIELFLMGARAGLKEVL